MPDYISTNVEAAAHYAAQEATYDDDRPSASDLAADDFEGIEYEVEVRNTFTASSPEDAVQQMVGWLLDNAHKAGYRVFDRTEDQTDDRGVFIDAEDVYP